MSWEIMDNKEFTIKEILRIFKLGKVGRQLLAERRELAKLRENEEKEFIDLLKLWIRNVDIIKL